MTTHTSLSPASAHTMHFQQGDSERFALALADQIECALLACDCNSVLLHANRSGRTALASGSAVTLVDGRVYCQAASQVEWNAAIRDAAIHHRCRLFWVGEHDHRTMIIAMPIVTAGIETPTAVVMLSRRNVCSKLGMELLASRHELTFAERRVFSALVENATPKEIAATHGVTVATIRTQIQSVRDKLGVRSIDALLLRAAEVPPISSWH